jgi:hypothetical protein
MSQNPLSLLDSQKYNYGTIPNQPVAEQNQTYFAYWNGIGGTGPEYIDGTAYFIKYLIDIKGNVTNPEASTVVDSPEAIALYNLKNNFEPGKRAIVKTLEPDPTSNIVSDAASLQGIHKIAHVGKIVPILVTETGENIQDYVTTMSFSQPITPSPPILFNIPNVNAQFQASFGNSNTVTTNNYTDLSYATTLTQYTNTNIWTNSSPEYIIDSSSIQTGTRIKIEAKIFVSSSYIFTPGVNGDPDVNTYYGGDFKLRILKNNNVITEGDSKYFNKGQTIGPDYISYINVGFGDDYYILTSDWIDYSADDEFKIQYQSINDNNSLPLQILGAGSGKSESRIRIIQEYQPGVSGSSSTEPLQIDGINVVYSGNGYFEANNVYNIDNKGYSTLTCNEALSNIFQTNLIQNLDPASKIFTFSDIKIPFSDIKPGDFIRFEYNKNQTYIITQIGYNGGTENVELTVIPSLSTISGFQTQTININHFEIYRVLNDGLYITLDVPKDTTGNAYTGLLLPEFISKELLNKLEILIQDLTAREIIQ